MQLCACEPADLLRNPNHILCPQLRAQLVSAAYLFLDTEKRIARYAAAGQTACYWEFGDRSCALCQIFRKRALVLFTS